jgi:hypothetical protein
MDYEVGTTWDSRKWWIYAAAVRGGPKLQNGLKGVLVTILGKVMKTKKQGKLRPNQRVGGLAVAG